MRLQLKWTLALFFIALQLSFAQQVSVRGTVKDDTGLPLPGVTILVKETSNGTQTDFDGNYSISVENGKTLVFSYVGMKTVEKKVLSKGEKNLEVSVSMESDAQELEAVVVTGITTTDKRLFTGASDRLKAEDIKLDGLPDVSRALEGRSAGVSVQNVSGTFGAAPKIRVRGATSILGSSKPLWVVDGIVLEDAVELSSDDLASGDVATLISSAIAGLNPDDIESFEVLKDGSATSIYGARAMGGVIVITTKRGAAGVSTFNYSGEFTYRMIPSYSQFNLMNSQEQMGVYEEIRRAGWLNQGEIVNRQNVGEYGRMYRLLEQLDASGNYLLENTPEAKARFLREAEYRNTNWFNELFVPNVMQSHSVSMSSGTKKSDYYASVSALVDPGWTLASNVNRYTANFKSNFRIAENLTVTAISSASYRKQKAPGTLSRSVDPVAGSVDRDFDINPFSYALNTSRILDPNIDYIRNYAPFNIKRELGENYIDLNIADLKFQTELRWKVTPKIETSVLGALKYQSTLQEHHVTEFSNQAEAYRAMPTTVIRDSNPFLYKDGEDPNALPIVVLPQGGIYRKTAYTMLGYDFRATASYKNVFDNIHTVNVYLGSEANSTDRRTDKYTGWGLQYSMGELPFYKYELFKKGIEDNNVYYDIKNTHYRNLAVFSNITYSWKRRYTLNGTLRYEGTNKLGKSRKSRWLPTWNISGAWNVHEEDFFSKLNPILSELTFKTSYSLTADRGPAYVSNSLPYIISQTPWRPTAGVKETALLISDLENSELTYEKKKELNIGVFAGFFNRRVAMSLDWYSRDNYDLIGLIDTQGLGGQITKYGNVASMKSSGFEVSLSTVNIKTRDFSWKTDFVYSKINNEITDLKNKTRVIDLVKAGGFAKEGYPVRSIFSIPFAGLNNEGIPQIINEKGEVSSKDINFQERDNTDYLIFSGNADPTDVGSIGNIFTYKGLKLNIFITYSFGNVIRLNNSFRSEYSDLDAMPKDFRDRWVLSGEENLTNIPVITSTRQHETYGKSNLKRIYNAYNYSDIRVVKGDFIRLKEVSLGYDFDKHVAENIGLKKLSVKLQATNPFLLYSDKRLFGQDPEFVNAGGVAVPVPKQITFTLRAGL